VIMLDVLAIVGILCRKPCTRMDPMGKASEDPVLE
jgi:hypothetical protein